MERQYTFQDFAEIIKTLRSENGCPWDREQTHESLKPCMTEEAAEMVASIRIYDKTGNAENMREELGDILLQVMLHSCIAEEEGLFTLDDVIQEISEKMIRRHPHVFADEAADTSVQVMKNWDEIKKKEKEGKDWIESPLREIPKELPALVRAPKVLKKMDKLYEKGKTKEELGNQMKETMSGLLLASEKKDIQAVSNHVSELLWEVSDLSRIFKIPQEQVLTDCIEDHIDRYEPETGR